MKKSSRITYEVTEQDIIRGVPGDNFRCPVARAMKRAGESLSTAVNLGVLPKKVDNFIEKFDELCSPEMSEKPLRGKARLTQFKPFKFTARISKEMS